MHAAGGLPGDLHKLWRSRGDGDYHSEYGYSCMGYEIAGALGVKMARPDREVYAVVGDGSYLMLNHEIVTSLQEGHKITVVLLDNHGYQCIHNLQRSCGSAGFGNEFRHRDSDTGPADRRERDRGLRGQRAQPGRRPRSPPERKRSWCARWTRPARRPRTCVVYVPVEPTTPLPGYSWWDVPVAAESDSAEVQAARRGYQKALRSRRFYY